MLPKHNKSAPHMFRRMVSRDQGYCRTAARTLVREEAGQILPLLLVMMVLLIGAGMLVLWLGVSTVITSRAQTAADAAALAGEQELVTEMQQIRYGPDGQVLPPSYDPKKVCAAAENYAANNHGYMSCPADIQFPPSATGLFGTDVEVTVHSDETLPSGAPGGAQGATATARASTDPFSQSSPGITTSTTSCDASIVDGSPFNPPTDGTGPGFFAQNNTDYSQGCEPKLAGKLQALAIAKGLHLVGVRGYDTSASTTGTTGAGGAGTTGGSDGAGAQQIDDAHSCGAASTTDGFPKPGTPHQVTDATLRSFGLTRPFPGAPDEIELIGAGGCTQQVSTTPGASQPVGFGNSDVHLVPINGGPVGSFATLPLSGGPVEITAQGLALGCQIWKIGNSLPGMNPTIMLSAFLAAYDESTMRNITTYDGQKDSLGMFQQRQSTGWGYPQQETNPPDAIRMYFDGDGANTPYDNGNGSSPGAIGNYSPGVSAWALAQTTQGSQPGDNPGPLYGSNYEAQMGPATTMIQDIQGGACKGH